MPSVSRPPTHLGGRYARNIVGGRQAIAGDLRRTGRGGEHQCHQSHTENRQAGHVSHATPEARRNTIRRVGPRPRRASGTTRRGCARARSARARPWRSTRSRRAAGGRTRSAAGSPLAYSSPAICAGERQPHVDARGDAGGGHDLALRNDAFLASARAEAGERLELEPVPSSRAGRRGCPARRAAASRCRRTSSTSRSRARRAASPGCARPRAGRACRCRRGRRRRRASGRSSKAAVASIASMSLSVRTRPGLVREPGDLRAGQAREHLVGPDRVEGGEAVVHRDGDVHGRSSLVVGGQAAKRSR